MKVTINPSKAKGVITAPPSKSMAHRALICGALSAESTIRNIAYSQDVEATLRCLEAMGTSIEKHEDSIILGGLDPFRIPADTVLDCGESGSTLRFLLPLCLLSDVPIHFVGSCRLFERPLDVYEEICKAQGLTFRRGEGAVTVCGKLSAGDYSVPGNISSQFVTGLMFALSLVDGNSTIRITDTFESKAYVKMTQSVQEYFGVASICSEMSVSVCGKGFYRSKEYIVEGDYSNAAFLEAFNLLEGDVKVLGLSDVSPQGDRVFLGLFQKLLIGTDVVDLSDCPDLGPVLFALAAALGRGKFVGTARLRLKESDRVSSMVQELKKFGARAIVADNTVEIYAEQLSAPAETLCGHNDHRIVMALSLLCSLVGGTVNGAEAVSKSFPNYFEVLRTLGINVIFD